MISPKQILLIVLIVSMTPNVLAQDVSKNPILSAEDIFGTKTGRDAIGIYSSDSVRGFSPLTAGNLRIEGMYFDEKSPLTARIIDAETVHVGLSAQDYAFPSPTGIVDLTLAQIEPTPRITPTVTLGPYGGFSQDIAVNVPLSEQFGLAGGVGHFNDHFGNGGRSRSQSAGVVSRWTPSPQFATTFFWGKVHTPWEAQGPVFSTDSDFLPSATWHHHYATPSWQFSHFDAQNYGVLSHLYVGEWSFRTGLFHSEKNTLGTMTDVLLLADQRHASHRVVIASPPSHGASDSGEIRLSRAINFTKIKHLVTVSLRGNQSDTTYGQSQTVTIPVQAMSGAELTPRPVIGPRALTIDQSRQLTVGISYRFRWGDRIDAGVGLMRTRSRQTIVQNQHFPVAEHDSIVQPNADVSYQLRPGLTVYGNYTEGLEQSGEAPGYAVNREQILPDIITRQWSTGVEWKKTRIGTVAASLFSIRKPYFYLHSQGQYTADGIESHRGLELSILSHPTKRLTVLSGFVVMDPSVQVDRYSSAERIGHIPVGQPKQIGQTNLNYTFAQVPNLSIGSSLQYFSSQQATNDNRITVPGFVLVNADLRYLFHLQQKEAVIRMNLQNLLNRQQLLVAGSSVYQFLDPRSLTLYFSLNL